jgi:DNA-binding protein HU-beta
MNRNELVEKVSKELDYPRHDVERILLSALKVITEQVKIGGKVNLAGFGQFSSGLRKARVGVNPRNPTEKINVPAVKVPKFRAGKNLKDNVKNSK